MYKLLGNCVRQAAPTGMAAFLVTGSTLYNYSILQLPLRNGKPLQRRLVGVKCIVID